MTGSKPALISKTEEGFRQYFNLPVEKVYFAPGRVNLIGEHLDYNGGWVLPAAIDLGIAAAIRLRDDGVLNLVSGNLEGVREIRVENLITEAKLNNWSDYPLGVLRELKLNGYDIAGADIYYLGNLPHGGGLSSSAAIEVLTAYIFSGAIKRESNLLERLALLSQKVENEFIGVNCGIMDQFAVALGEANKCIMLKSDTLDYKLTPFKTENVKIVIINSNKRRELSGSEYNNRHKECKSALKKLNSEYQLQSLAQAEKYQLSTLDERLQRRVRHVITENDRVLQAVEAVKNDDFDTFGRLLNDSHDSLKNDFEVSCRELDVISEEGREIKGCKGARMTGAGFGGSAVAVVETEAVESFTGRLDRIYTEKTGLKAEFFTASISRGVDRIS